MTWDEEHDLLSRYSRGDLDRKGLQAAMEWPIDFGDTLRKLYEHKLPLPRGRYDPDRPGVQLLRSALRNAALAAE